LFNLEHLDSLRRAEICKIVTHFRAGARILELGAGTGQQAQELSNLGFAIDAIEIPSSNYADTRRFPIVEYDGLHIPFPDDSFDIVFSSNVLEHVRDIREVSREIHRVLKPDGYCVHVLPTHSWRFWTTLSSFPTAVQYIWDMLRHTAKGKEGKLSRGKYAKRLIRHLVSPLMQKRHGERGNLISETWLFHPRWWRRTFEENGFAVIHEEPMGLFYTGNMTIGARWSIDQRERLSKILGSACHLYEVRPTKRPAKLRAGLEIISSPGASGQPSDASLMDCSC
jgi:ubiquinone/menaquinone biosynthesis C-methylase UbiE